jgi:Protein of unknown function (DUF2800)
MSHSSNGTGSLPYKEIKEIKINLLEEQWGYIDRILLWPQLKEADLLDLKTGKYPVDPVEKNLQIQFYTTGLFDNIGWLQRIRGHIIQPHLNYADYHTFSREEDLERLKNKILAIIHNARIQAGKIYHPGWEQCRFCGNKANCLALRDFANAIVPAYEPTFHIPEPIHPSQITDIETLNNVLMFAKVMEKWCDSVKHHVTELAKQGHDFRNFRLIEISGHREITRPVRAWELLQEQGWTLEEYLACCDVQIGKLDKTLMEKAPKGQKKHSQEEFSDLLKDENAMEIKPPTYQMRARPVALSNQ